MSVPKSNSDYDTVAVVLHPASLGLESSSQYRQEASVFALTRTFWGEHDSGKLIVSWAAGVFIITWPAGPGGL